MVFTHKSGGRKNKRRMISEEIHDFEKSKRLAIAVAQPKQGAWTRWENTKDRTITWSDIKQMEPKQLGFLIKAVYDTSKFKALGVKYI